MEQINELWMNSDDIDSISSNHNLPSVLFDLLF